MSEIKCFIVIYLHLAVQMRPLRLLQVCRLEVETGIIEIRTGEEEEKVCALR